MARTAKKKKKEKNLISLIYNVISLIWSLCGMLGMVLFILCICYFELLTSFFLSPTSIPLVTFCFKDRVLLLTQAGLELTIAGEPLFSTSLGLRPMILP